MFEEGWVLAEVQAIGFVAGMTSPIIDCGPGANGEWLMVAAGTEQDRIDQTTFVVGIEGYSGPGRYSAQGGSMHATMFHSDVGEYRPEAQAQCQVCIRSDERSGFYRCTGLRTGSQNAEVVRASFQCAATDMASQEIGGACASWCSATSCPPSMWSSCMSGLCRWDTQERRAHCTEECDAPCGDASYVCSSERVCVPATTAYPIDLGVACTENFSVARDCSDRTDGRYCAVHNSTECDSGRCVSDPFRPAPYCSSRCLGDGMSGFECPTDYQCIVSPAFRGGYDCVQNP